MQTMEDVSGMLHFKTVSYGGLEYKNIMSLPNGRGSWVVGTSRGSWMWVWVKVVGVGND